VATKDIVVIPTFSRPEFLALCLEKLDLAIDAPDDIRIYLDTSSEARVEEVEYLRDTRLPRAQIFHAKKHPEVASGCYNILKSIETGYNTGADFIWLVEEDVLVKPGIFTWGREQMATGQYLAACGRKDPSFYHLHPDQYTNPGSVLSRTLVEHLIPHINTNYFSRLREYLDEHFDLWPEMSNLDDGLIRRVIRQMDGKAVYPDKPVCAHQGFRLYGKLDLYQNQEVGIEKRIARLREIISKIRPGERYARDFEPF
jgi:hypothetical protein